MASKQTVKIQDWKNNCFYFVELDMSGVTSRSGRVIKKSTKLMDFTSPDDIETLKAKKMASASRKLNMVKLNFINKYFRELIKFVF